MIFTYHSILTAIVMRFDTNITQICLSSRIHYIVTVSLAVECNDHLIFVNV